MNKLFIKSQIQLHGDTTESLASKFPVKVSRQAISKKINGGTAWKDHEIKFLAYYYKWSKEDLWNALCE